MTRDMKTRIKSKSTIQPNGCWLWFGHIDKYGYGSLKVGRKTKTAHRTSFETFVGPVEAGASVLHRCDNRACVNPDHLFIGDQRENIRDMMAKGRKAQQKGAANSGAKLSDDQVIAIRGDTRAQAEIGKDYGITQSLVSYIKSRRLWGHLP